MHIPVEPIGILLWIEVIAMFFFWLYRRRKKNNAITTGKWANWINGNEVHTVPVGDLIDHEYNDCACSPETIPVEAENGAMNWQILHYALDGRK